MRHPIPVAPTGSHFRVALAVCLTLCLLVPRANALTWYVNVYGTGDAPTIWAAMDSATAGDTVLVGPGEYVVTYQSGSIGVGAGVTMKSEAGPLSTKVRFDWFWTYGVYLGHNSTLDGFWVASGASRSVGMGVGSSLKRSIIVGLTDVSYGEQAHNNLFLGPVRFGTELVDFHHNVVYGFMDCVGLLTCPRSSYHLL